MHVSASFAHSTMPPITQSPVGTGKSAPGQGRPLGPAGHNGESRQPWQEGDPSSHPTARAELAAKPTSVNSGQTSLNHTREYLAAEASGTRAKPPTNDANRRTSRRFRRIVHFGSSVQLTNVITASADSASWLECSAREQGPPRSPMSQPPHLQVLDGRVSPAREPASPTVIGARPSERRRQTGPNCVENAPETRTDQ